MTGGSGSVGADGAPPQASNEAPRTENNRCVFIGESSQATPPPVQSYFVQMDFSIGIGRKPRSSSCREDTERSFLPGTLAHGRTSDTFLVRVRAMRELGTGLRAVWDLERNDAEWRTELANRILAPLGTDLGTLLWAFDWNDDDALNIRPLARAGFDLDESEAVDMVQTAPDLDALSHFYRSAPFSGTMGDAVDATEIANTFEASRGDGGPRRGWNFCRRRPRRRALASGFFATTQSIGGQTPQPRRTDCAPVGGAANSPRLERRALLRIGGCRARR